jgi:hypothetical protein
MKSDFSNNPNSSKENDSFELFSFGHFNRRLIIAFDKLLERP